MLNVEASDGTSVARESVTIHVLAVNTPNAAADPALALKLSEIDPLNRQVPVPGRMVISEVTGYPHPFWVDENPAKFLNSTIGATMANYDPTALDKDSAENNVVTTEATADASPTDANNAPVIPETSHEETEPGKEQSVTEKLSSPPGDPATANRSMPAKAPLAPHDAAAWAPDTTNEQPQQASPPQANRLIDSVKGIALLGSLGVVYSYVKANKPFANLFAKK
jgi:hypothetical protein